MGAGAPRAKTFGPDAPVQDAQDIGAMAELRKQKTPREPSPVTAEQVRAIAGALPKVKEGPSYGTPGFRVAGKLFARLHQDGESLVVRISPEDRAMRMRAEPEAFYITEHYRNYPWMLVRLAKVSLEDLRELLEDGWRCAAPARVVATRNARAPTKQPGPKESSRARGRH
jgi:hypothetical protein